ncbi:hypothetical protein WH47_00556 [Habropoda laboriosa]|uniref:Uncharacterized protein n=1 Tax=Habropoda laboriosa TaxID=597456 RepID=A0A0L7R4A5_9HYME|nr:hypothetical protein WH47_00556 [Habropoda laboriosa]
MFVENRNKDTLLFAFCAGITDVAEGTRGSSQLNPKLCVVRSALATVILHNCYRGLETLSKAPYLKSNGTSTGGKLEITQFFIGTASLGGSKEEQRDCSAHNQSAGSVQSGRIESIVESIVRHELRNLSISLAALRGYGGPRSAGNAESGRVKRDSNTGIPGSNRVQGHLATAYSDSFLEDLGQWCSMVFGNASSGP